MAERTNYSQTNIPDDIQDELNLDSRTAAFDELIEEEDEQDEVVSDLPQYMTESLGTGVKDMPGVPRHGGRTAERRMDSFNEAGPELTGGDIDANFEQANAVGDEAVGGTVATPDQDIVDEIAIAVGVELDDRTDVRISDMLNERDDRRWELDPSSSEDYQERRNAPDDEV